MRVREPEVSRLLLRIYRDVHEDVDALGPVPFAITQLQEWSEVDQRKADAWEAKRNIIHTQLMAGRYGELQKTIDECEQEKQQLRRKQYNLDELEARAHQADELVNQMNREINEAYRGHADVATIEEAIKTLNDKANAIASTIKENTEYARLAEQVQAHEKKTREIDAQVRALPECKAVATKIEAANQARDSAKQCINNLPQLTELSAQIERETDSQKEQELQEKHDRLSQQLLSGDLQYQQAGVASARLNRVLHNMLRWKVRAERRKLESQGNALRKDRDELLATLTAAHPGHAKLQKELAANQELLADIRTIIQQRIQSRNVYKDAEQKRDVARKARDDANHACRHADGEDDRNQDVARLDDRVVRLQQEANRLRDAVLKAAHVLGDNPYPGAEAAESWDHQQNLTYHTTADWDTGTREEIEGRVTPTFKNWLLRVRGY